MSTIHISGKQFGSVAKSLGHYANCDRSSRSSGMVSAELCRALGVEPFGDDDKPTLAARFLVSDWQRVNTRAFVERYNEKRELAVNLRGGKLLSLPALLKALRSIRYNCDDLEGDTLSKIIEVITEAIIVGLPEYQNAEWVF